MGAPSQARRNQESRRAIIAAALSEATEKGLENTTIEAIAARAGVGKQTIYRWWPSKAAIVLEALGDEASAPGRGATFPDTGDIRADLRTQMRATVRAMRAPSFVTYRGLIAAAQADPDVARSVEETIIRPRVAACRERLRSAQAVGQIDAAADLDVLVEVLYGPLYYRLLLHTRPVSNAQVDAILDLALPR
jgi:AcrR family transcriptional regulator